MTDQIPVRRALISVYDKTGLVDLARGLADAGVELISTGSTAATIAAAGISVTPVEKVTEFPGMPGRPRQDPAPAHPRRHPR